MFDTRKFILTVAATGAVTAFAVETPPGTSAATILGEERIKAIRTAMLGEWLCEIGTVRSMLTFHDDAKFTIGEKEGSFRIDGDTVTLLSENGEITYQIKLSGKELTLSGGDLAAPLEFTKVPRFGQSQTWRARWSWPSVKVRTRRIVMIAMEDMPHKKMTM